MIRIKTSRFWVRSVQFHHPRLLGLSLGPLIGPIRFSGYDDIFFSQYCFDDKFKTLDNKYWAYYKYYESIDSYWDRR